MRDNKTIYGAPADTGFDCDHCELLLPEAVEGSLTDAEQALVDRHVLGCTACAEAMAEAQRGLAWLTMLKSTPPEPPAALLESILAQTIGRESKVAEVEPVFAPFPATVISASQPAVQTGGWRATLRSWWGDWTQPASGSFSGLQPRLAMTSAMAFVSVMLTLNLMGVPLRSLADVHARDLRPATAKRLAAQAGASVMRRVQGNRAVYEVESRVNELRAGSGLDRGFFSPDHSEQ